MLIKNRYILLCVEQKDIENGVNSVLQCSLALALNRRLMQKAFVMVDGDYVC